MVPALVLDRRRDERLTRSARRAAFFCGAVGALAAEIAAAGSRLIVRSGPALSTVLRLAREAGAHTVVWSAGYDAATASADRDLQASLEERGLRVLVVHDAPIVPPEETGTVHTGAGSGYRALAPYLVAWGGVPRTAAAGRVTFAPPPAAGGEPLPEPQRFGSDAAAAPDATGAAARAALSAFMRGPVLGYAVARDVPAQPTSKLSAHLSFGTISAREVLRAVDERAADPFLLAEERQSLRAFSLALARRDFFLQLAWSSGGRRDRPLQERMRGFPARRSHPALAAWSAGMTGYPLVDAGMRELAVTGTMHPRVRQIAASFLCFDLGVDWRVGRDAWDALLVEDDPALADGNWQWVAGVGADLAQVPRIFNPRKQARRMDPAGTYVKRWIDELADVPPADIFESHARSRSPQLALDLFAAGTYPAPVVDHETAAREYLRRYAAFVRERRTAGTW